MGATGPGVGGLVAGNAVQVMYDGTSFQIMTGQQAGLIGVQDAGNYYVATTQEAVDAEIGAVIRPWVTATDPRFGGAVSGSWHTAINAAGAYAAANGLGLRLLPQNGGYPHTGVIVLPPNIPIDMTGTYTIYSGARPAIAVTIGTAGTPNIKQWIWVDCRNATLSWDAWTPMLGTAPDDVTLLLNDPIECTININRVDNATCGYVLASSAGAGANYNDIRAHKIQDCRYGEVFRTYNSSGNINDNNIAVGSSANSSLTNGLGSAYGTVFCTYDSVHSSSVNNNRWWGRAYELGGNATNTVRIPIWHAGCGSHNFWIRPRHESNSGVFALCDGNNNANAVVNNIYDIGYSSELTPVVADVSQINSAYGNQYLPTWQANRNNQTWFSGDISSFISGQAANTAYIGGPFHFVQNNATVSKTLTNGSLDVGYEKGIEYFLANGGNMGVGVFISCPTTRNFHISSNTVPGFSGRIYIQCFD